VPYAKTGRAFCALLVALGLAIPAVILVSAVAGTSSHTEAAGAAVADGRDVGFSYNGDILQWDSSKITAEFSDAKSIGATWVRVPFSWTTLEMHGKGQYNWSPADKVVLIANGLGLKVEADVSYTPAWARPSGTNSLYPPTNMNDYGDFIAAAVAHYKGLGVHVWEIWNEPNIYNMWAPLPNPGLYTSMLKTAYPRVKAVDPNATVVVGSTAPSADDPTGRHIKPYTFLADIYAAGAHGYFDAFGHHPESFPHPSSYDADWNAFQQTKDIYALMVAHGDGNKKIWGTELAFPTGTSTKAVSESAQGLLFAESLRLWNAWSFTGPVFIYSERDVADDLAVQWDNYGVTHYDGSHKAGWGVIQQTLRAPQNVHATAGTGGAAVYWDAPGYDYGTPITNYRVYASPSGINVTVPGTARVALIALPAGQSYKFQVIPVRNGVNGVASQLSSVAVTPALPKVIPGTGAVVEGNSGTTTMFVPVTLSNATTQTVTVKYTTLTYGAQYQAAPGYDYNPTSGTLTFAPGETHKNIGVTIIGDTVNEPNDSFLFAVGSAANATIGGFGGMGHGVILNDDG
jgi:hypothetical protein